MFFAQISKAVQLILQMNLAHYMLRLGLKIEKNHETCSLDVWTLFRGINIDNFFNYIFIIIIIAADGGVKSRIERMF